MIKGKIGLAFSLLFFSFTAQAVNLKSKIEQIVVQKELKLGVAVMDLATGENYSINSEEHFPMQSLFKLHLSLLVLHCVDQGRFNLTDTLQFNQSELYEHLWSPIRQAHPNGTANLPLSEVIAYTIQQSDNSGCDKLIKLVGGIECLNRYLQSIGVEGVNIEDNEWQLQSDWNKQFRNWTTPSSSIGLLRLINSGTLLSAESQSFLWKTMFATASGSIRNLLPNGSQIAHKTGYSGQNEEGVTAANNDIGIMVLPNGKRIAYAIFITNSIESNAFNYEVIAAIGREIYTYFMTKE
ncbi:MAG: class A beta-lactamase [Phocaeicola sp.]